MRIVQHPSIEVLTYKLDNGVIFCGIWMQQYKYSLKVNYVIATKCNIKYTINFLMVVFKALIKTQHTFCTTLRSVTALDQLRLLLF